VTDLRPRRAQAGASNQRRTTLVVAIAVGAVLIVAAIVAVLALTPTTQVAAPSPSPTQTRSPSATSSPTPIPTPTPTFNRAAFSIDDPGSFWVVANKLRPLNPPQYEPAVVSVPVDFANEPFLRQEASDAVVQMFAAFTAETGLFMQSQSAYRSYWAQESVYAGWVSSLGQEGADLTSARPGHSEHQTGLAIDVSALPANCSLDQCFADTPQGQWLAANGWKYGFIVRYPNGYTQITGYEFEPWHMRFVGVELATELHTTGVLTLEEFFGLPPAPTYG
jgi:D-alanyl-D-alanine carboxypeptidase